MAVTVCDVCECFSVFKVGVMCPQSLKLELSRENQMEHAEFVQSWNAGKLEVDVDRSKALQVAGSNMLPKRYQAAHIFWSWVWMLSIPASVAVMYFYTWWAGLIILVLIAPALLRSTKESAMEFMIDHSVENPEFYRFAVSEGVISVRQKPNYDLNRMRCNDGAIKAEVITYKPGAYCQLQPCPI